MIDFPGDSDWFAVTLEADKAYGIDLKGSATLDGTLTNPYLRGVYDADGVFITGTTDDDSGSDSGSDTNSRVYFTPTADGVYFVAAGAVGNLTGEYTLSVTPPDDFTSNTETAGMVDVGGSASGEIDFGGDHDWFAVALFAGRYYRFELAGLNGESDTLVDPFLRGIHNEDGDLIAGTTDDNVDPDGSLSSLVYFRATADATYYVAAGAVGSGTGTYTLSVEELDDDFTANTQTIGKVDVGGSSVGNLETSGDRDWFAVELGADTIYRFHLAGQSEAPGTLPDPYLHGIYDEDGELIDDTTNNDGFDDGTFSAIVYFTPTEDGTYFVSARSYVRPNPIDRVDPTGTYTLSVSEAEDDFTADPDTAGMVEVGGSALGKIDSWYERDWFAVTLEARTNYRIDLSGTPDRTVVDDNVDPYLRGIYDADGVLIDGTTDYRAGPGRNSRVYFTATEDATYYVAAGANGKETGDYELSVIVNDRFTANTNTDGTVEVGGSSRGELDFDGDRDWFAVELTRGRFYQIDLEGWSSGAGTLADPVLLGVYDENGVRIPGTTKGGGGWGTNSRLAFTAPETATYYVAAGAYGDLTGTYKLSVTDARDVTDDFEAGTGTSGTVEVGGSETGEIESRGDRDWFAVELEAGHTYRIDLEGAPTGLGTLRHPYLHGIYDESGDLISNTTDDDGGVGRNSRVEFTAGKNGTHYVAAGPDGNEEGTYTLSVIDVTDDVTAGTGTSGTVDVGDPAMGEIHYPEDRDWFAVELEAGHTYRIDLEGSGTGGGTLDDPYLRGIFDPRGIFIDGTWNDDGGEGYNSRLRFTATERGTYYVAVGGAFRDSEGTYTLSVKDFSDDFGAGTTTAGTVDVDGSATGEIEFTEDRDWFAVELDRGTTYWIDLEGSETGGGTLDDPLLRGVYDSSGTLIDGTRNDDGGQGYNSRLRFTAPEDGTYYVAARGLVDGVGTYTLSVTEISNDFAASTATGGRVEVDSSATGTIGYVGDRDWFAVTLQAGNTYRIDLEGSQSGGGTLDDPYLHGVYDESGTFIDGTSDDGSGPGHNSRVVFTPDRDGTYYVSAGAWQTHVGTYKLSVTQVADQLVAWRATTGAVDVGSPATSRIDFAGDRDWFAVDLDAGQAYRIDLKGSWTRDGTLYDPYLRGVYDEDGDRIGGTRNDDGGRGRNSRVEFTPEEDGIYYVSAGAWRAYEGTYTLTVEEVM